MTPLPTSSREQLDTLYRESLFALFLSIRAQV